MRISGKEEFFFWCQLLVSFIATESYPDNWGIAGRFHTSTPARSCEYRRQKGFCKYRSQCKRPTKHLCRIGANPIVCCLDEPVRSDPHPPPAVANVPNTDDRPDEDIDITYPGCGMRPIKDAQGRVAIPGRRHKVDISSIQHVIVGGVEAEPNSWPWMAHIKMQTAPGRPKKFLCGASLISKRFVLTAAHCFDGEKGHVNPAKFSVFLAAHTTDSEGAAEYAVENVLVHPEYKARQYYNDIALLKLAADVFMSPLQILPVCLPSSGLKSRIRPNASKVTVTGWGDTSFGGFSSKTLQELQIPIVPLKKCNESYSKVNLASFPRGITPLFICAGVDEGGKDACQGDSGGPMVHEVQGGIWVQLGVVSFGYGCARPGFPGVYTRVSKYTRWIHDNTDLGHH